MSTTITKRADELKRGDVVTDFLGTANVRCPAVLVDNYSCGAIRAHDALGGVGTILIGYAQTVEVEAPTLTPAQQHAEELLSYTRMLQKLDDVRLAPPADMLSLEQRAKLDALLAKIDPPQPPTLEEALAMLQTVMERRDNTPEAVALLDRARRSGKLK